MKNLFNVFLLLSVFCICGVQKSKAQGNLQFNQVVFYDFPASGTQTITIPAGKVWKIEAANNYNSNGSGIALRNSAVQLIGNISTAAAVSNPFWLPSGFTGSFLNSNSGGRACISIIEFNVVP